MSELEQAGDWVSSAGCCRMLLHQTSARGGQQLAALGLEPAYLAWAASAPLGWGWPRDGMAARIWAGCAVTAAAGRAGLSLSLIPWFEGAKNSLVLSRLVVFEQLCAVPGEKWDSCTSGCCLSALAWSWHACWLACWLEKLENCSWCPLGTGKGNLAWALRCLPQCWPVAQPAIVFGSLQTR